jgi:hypothetical protein
MPAAFAPGAHGLAGAAEPQARAARSKSVWVRWTSATNTSCLSSYDRKNAGPSGQARGQALPCPPSTPIPLKSHPPSPRLTHDVQRMGALRGLCARISRDTGPGRIAPRCRPSPSADRAACQREHGAVHRTARQTPPPGSCRPYPAAPTTAVPHPPNDRPPSGQARGLGKATFVDDQATRRFAAQQAIRVLADLGQHWLVIPRRITDAMLELLSAAVVNHACHRGKGPVLRLRQSAQIAPRDRRAVARLAAEEPTAAADEERECVRDPFDQRSGQTSSEHTVTRRIGSLISSSHSIDSVEAHSSTNDSYVNPESRGSEPRV